MKYIEAASRNIARVAEGNKIIVEKSTVPVKAAERYENGLHLSIILEKNEKMLSCQIFCYLNVCFWRISRRNDA